MTLRLAQPVLCDSFQEAQRSAEEQGRDLDQRQCQDYILWILRDLRPGDVCPHCALYYRRAAGRKWNPDEGRGDTTGDSVRSVALQWWFAQLQGRFIPLPPHMRAMQCTAALLWPLQPTEQPQTLL